MFRKAIAKTGLLIDYYRTKMSFGEYCSKLGDKYFEFGDLKEAEAAYLRAIKHGISKAYMKLSAIANQRNQKLDAIFYIALMHEAQQNWVEAIKVYEIMSQKEDKGLAYYRLALLYKTYRYSKNLNGEIVAVIKKSKANELEYLVKSAKRGNDSATEILEKWSKVDADAAYSLAQVLETNKKTFQEAVELYLFAATQKHIEALNQIELLRDELSEKTLLQLAEIYLTNLEQPKLALEWLYYLLTEKKISAAQNRIISLAKDPENSFLLAELYESHVNEESTKKALKYYVQGALRRHDLSLNRLIFLATFGDAQAQLALGCDYYYQNMEFNKAMHWCVLSAEQNYEPAKKFLSESNFNAEQYLIIAKEYERGDIVKNNLNQVLEFYNKACFLKSMEAALFLGRFYLVEHKEIGIAKDNEMACDYLIRAAQYGASEALTLLDLERMKSKVSPAMQIQLALMYESLGNWEEALVIYSQMDEEFENGLPKYRLGCLFSKDRYRNSVIVIKEDTEKVIKYYSESASKRNHEALFDLRDLSKSNADAAYSLAQIIEQIYKEYISEAVKLYLHAATQKHLKALKWLESHIDTLSDKWLFKLAEIYLHSFNQPKAALSLFHHLAEKGDQKSTQQLEILASQDSENAYEVAVYYEITNFELACKYYLIAASKNHQDAMLILEKCFDKLTDASQLELGRIYRGKGDALAALKCFKLLADKNHNQASTELSDMMTVNVANVFLLAQLYESENSSDLEICNKAVDYYLCAALKGHQHSLEHLTSLAKSGNKAIQYVLGYEYYIKKNQFKEGIYWCMLAAEQDYTPAKDYLSLTKFDAKQCLLMAEKYQNGDGVQVDIENSVKFYEKSYLLGDAAAALFLGYFWLVDHPELNILQDTDNACEYLIQAALRGSEDALTSLECNAHDASSSIQMKISMMYQQNPVKDPLKEMLWNEEASSFVGANFNFFATQPKSYTQEKNSSSFTYKQ